MAAESRARWPEGDIEDIADRLIELLRTDRAVIEARTDAGVVDHFLADAALWTGARDSATTSKGIATAATATKATALATAYAFVSGAHKAALHRRGVPAAVLKGLGVRGARVQEGNVKSIAGALQAIIDAGTAHPEWLKYASLLPADVLTATTLRDAIVGAQATKSAKSESKKSVIAARKALQLRLELGVTEMVAAALVAYAGTPARRDQYAALIPGTTKPKKPPPTKT